MDVEIVEPDFLHDDLVCSVCFAEFLDKEDLELHVHQLHLDKSSKSRFCTLCTYIFPDIEKYALHLRNIHFNDLKCCKYCNRLFASTTEVQEHERKHNAAQLYPSVSCSHCSRVFDKKMDLKNHELAEHADFDEGIMIGDCSSILSALLCMNIKDFLTASLSNLPYVCVVCNETTADVRMYIDHLRVDKCRSLACNDCCNVYPSKSQLRKHIRQHRNCSGALKTDATEKQCYKCKAYFKAWALKSHIKKCTGVRCVLCDLTFNSVVEYTSHRMTEHQTKLLALEVCAYCQRQMVGAEAMEKHIERMHKNDKHLYKYHCTDCNRIFKHPKLLFAHFYTQHKDLNPYTCKICDKKFRLRKNFTLHIKLTHKSIGYVEFDENFHVFFTDRKPNNESKGPVYETSASVGNDFKPNSDMNNENNDNYDDDDDDNKRPVQDIEMTNNDSEQSEKLEISAPSNDAERENINDMESNGSQYEIVGVNKNNPKKIDNEKIYNSNDTLVVKRPSVKKVGRKRKHTAVKNKKIKHVSDANVSSDDSDAPLETLCKKKKFRKIKLRTPLNKSFKSKFFCNKCRKNYYTYQNYHRHNAVHMKTEFACIKCYSKFNTVKALKEHIKTKHSTSKLTETLKKLLEKRKTDSAKRTQTEQPTADEDVTLELSTTEKIRNTIKKVDVERSTTRVTMKLVDKDKISVKRYLENFTPDNNDVKITVLKHTVPFDALKRPLIKLTKFTEEPTRQIREINLKMPEKFTDNYREKVHVSINLLSYDQASATKLSGGPIQMESVNDDEYDNIYDDRDTYETYAPELQNKEVIPEVGHEVMLVDTQQRSNIVHTMSLTNLPASQNLQIAHLSAEAPYFKITKVNPDKIPSFTLLEREEDVQPPKDITLANGRKLVSANPFAHLLDNKAIEELKNSKNKKCAYKPKLTNVAEAITRAMEKLEKPPIVREKKKM